MLYNLADNQELAKAREYLNQVAREKKRIEIKQISERRSLSQNNYMWLLLEYFGAHFGYKKEEAYEIFRDLNKSTFLYEKKGRTFKRGTSEITKEEMVKCIDRFKVASAKQGCELPDADNEDFLNLATNTVEAHKQYL